MTKRLALNTVILLLLLQVIMLTVAIKVSENNSTMVTGKKNGSPRSPVNDTDDLFKFSESGQSLKCYDEKTLKLHIRCLNKVIQEQEEKNDVLQALVLIGAGRLLHERRYHD